MSKKEKEIEKEKEVETTKRKFRVLYPLFKDGKPYNIGDVEEFALTEEQEVKLIGQSLEEVG